MLEKKLSDKLGDDFKGKVVDEISIAELLTKKLRRYISRLDGLERGNLHEIVLKEVEKPLFQMVLQETKWNQKKAANILGINRNTLRKRIKEYNLYYQEDK